MQKKMIFAMILITVAALLSSGFKDNSSNKQRSAAPKVFTTVDRTLIPDNVPAIPTVSISDPGNFKKYGFGTWHYGPGVPIQKRLDLMPAGYDYASVTKSATLLRFFTITDIHITDKESPAQPIYFAPEAGGNAISVYSPLMLYTTQVFDATVKTINKVHAIDPFDLGLALGDMANSSQYNEMRWFIDIMDGKMIKPSSGIQKPVTDNHYQDPFQAAGLNKSIPWYAAIGNHDHFFLGSKPIDEKIKNTMVGGNILQLGDIFTDPKGMEENTYSTGTLDGSTRYGTIIGCGKVADMGKILTISPDTNRHALTIPGIIAEFSKTTSNPKGHGFVQSDPANVLGGCYSFLPKAGLPLKIIVLDDTQDASEAPYQEGFYGHGELTPDRYYWLMAQLRAGQAANQLMVISAHIPIGTANGYGPFGWRPNKAYPSEAALIDSLKAFPNLILWVAGHRHLNNITALPSTTPGHPENGFWEVETKSIREFPEQFRTFDIVRNSDNTISILTIDVDAETTPGTLADIGRSYAVASNQIYRLNGEPFETGSVSYNAELVKQVSPAMAERIKKYVGRK